MVSEIIRQKYYEFYTEKLLESENTFSFFNWNNPIHNHIIAINYLLVLLLSIQLGTKNYDYQLINLAFIGLFDIFVELFDLAPNWRRR